MVCLMPRKQKYKLPDFIRGPLNYLSPPEKLNVSEWAEKHRMLDAKTSAMPGPWRNEVTPYLAGIMDEFNNPDTEEIVYVKPTQVGGSEALNNMVGYVVMQDPSPVMIVYPKDDLAKFVSDNRIQPMLTLSKGMRDKFHKNMSSQQELQCDGMFISLNGANSPSDLAAKAIRFLFLDEVDKYPGASKKEADPVELARERTKTFSNRKIFITSTPTLKTNHIWKAKENADVVKKYFVPCPNPMCGEKIELLMEQIKWSEDKSLSNADRAATAKYHCQHCGMPITDLQKKQQLKLGEWIPVERKTNNPRKVCYWMNTLYSPFVTFAEIAKKFLDTHKDPEALQNFVNSWLAEPWEDTKLKTTADLVMERQTEVEKFMVPDWAEVLTGGVDVQEQSLYWTIRAWGKHMTSQNIAHGQVLSFKQIEDIMNAEYKNANGESFMVNLAAIDSGDQTDAVYDFCSTNSEWAIPVKGVASGYSHFKISTINRASSSAHGTRLLLVDGNRYKDMIASRMKRKNGEGSWMVHKDCDRNYAEQVTAEHKVNVKVSGGASQQVWKPKTSHADNHYLDCEVYCMAAADVLGVRALHLMEEEKEVIEQPKEQNINQQALDYNSSWINGSGWLGGG